MSEPAAEFEELFRRVYLTFHRRDAPRSGLTGTSRGVLEHLVFAGPLNIGEMAKHLDRSQSVVSEIVSHLERDGLLARDGDPADRRRTLVWLTDAGHHALERDRRVLSQPMLAQAFRSLPADETTALLGGMRSLLAGPTSGKDVDHDL